MHFNIIPNRGAVLGSCTAGLLAASMAGADVIFTAQATLPPPREEVVFNEPGLTLAGTMVEGVTNQTEALIQFFGTEPLVVTASGQARIEADDDGFTDLLIDPDGDVTFDGLGFNLFAEADGQVTITGHRVGEPDVSETFSLSRNGQNRFVVQATNGDRLESVSFSSNVDISDIRQVRITGIPEPTATALLAAGGLIALRRRSRR